MLLLIWRPLDSEVYMTVKRFEITSYSWVGARTLGCEDLDSVALVSAAIANLIVFLNQYVPVGFVVLTWQTTQGPNTGQVCKEPEVSLPQRCRRGAAQPHTRLTCLPRNVIPPRNSGDSPNQQISKCEAPTLSTSKDSHTLHHSTEQNNICRLSLFGNSWKMDMQIPVSPISPQGSLNYGKLLHFDITHNIHYNSSLCPPHMRFNMTKNPKCIQDPLPSFVPAWQAIGWVWVVSMEVGIGGTKHPSRIESGEVIFDISYHIR
jgi:hypothetical protein